MTVSGQRDVTCKLSQTEEMRHQFTFKARSQEFSGSTSFELSARSWFTHLVVGQCDASLTAAGSGEGIIMGDNNLLVQAEMTVQLQHVGTCRHSAVKSKGICILKKRWLSSYSAFKQTKDCTSFPWQAIIAHQSKLNSYFRALEYHSLLGADY